MKPLRINFYLEGGGYYYTWIKPIIAEPDTKRGLDLPPPPLAQYYFHILFSTMGLLVLPPHQ